MKPCHALALYVSEPVSVSVRIGGGKAPVESVPCGSMVYSRSRSIDRLTVCCLLIVPQEQSLIACARVVSQSTLCTDWPRCSTTAQKRSCD